MTYNRLHARALLDASELALFEASVGDALTGSSPARLGQKIKRASSLRDKYRDLLRRQKLATRARTGTKLGAGGDANARTEQKIKLFEEVLQRFNAQQAKRTAAERQEERSLIALERLDAQKPGEHTEARSGKRKAVPVSAKAEKIGKVAGPNANNAAQRAHLAAVRTKMIQTHVASRGRVRQAVRDKR